MINYIGENGGEKECVSDEFLGWAVDYHNSLIDFKKRPITSFLIEKTRDLFDIRTSEAYVLVDFGFFFLCGFLIYYLARLYAISHAFSIISVVIFFLSFSILLGFFIPIATYDEPVQYFLILLSLIALRKKWWAAFVISFTLAIIARESALILLPGLLLFYMGIEIKGFFRQKKKLLGALLLCALPFTFYALYLLWFYNSEPQLIAEAQAALNERADYFGRNFSGVAGTTRTLISFFSIYLLPFFLLFVYFLNGKDARKWQKPIKAFGLTLLLNTLVVFVSVYAEEARVFALPLLFIFPVMGQIWGTSFSWSKSFWKYFIVPWRVFGLLLFTAAAWFLLKYLYAFNDINIVDSLFFEYNVLTFLLLGLLFFSFIHTKMVRTENGLALH